MFKSTSRFWNAYRRRGKPHTKLVTSEMLCRGCIQTRSTIRHNRRKPTNGESRVYLVHTATKHEPAQEFVKIGVTSKPIADRFRCDEDTYQITVVALSAILPTKDALILEQAIHRAFGQSRIYPVIPLRSGNTECYAATEENAKLFADLVNAI